MRLRTSRPPAPARGEEPFPSGPALCVSRKRSVRVGRGPSPLIREPPRWGERGPHWGNAPYEWGESHPQRYGRRPAGERDIPAREELRTGGEKAVPTCTNAALLGRGTYLSETRPVQAGREPSPLIRTPPRWGRAAYGPFPGRDVGSGFGDGATVRSVHCFQVARPVILDLGMQEGMDRFERRGISRRDPHPPSPFHLLIAVGDRVL